MNYKKRLTLLSSTEINEYFELPQFTDRERQHFFGLSSSEQSLMESLSQNTRWYFILELAYVKAKKQIFVIDMSEVAIDLEFVVQNFDLKYPIKNVSEDTHRKIRRMILMYLDFDDNLQVIKNILEEKARELIKTTNKPKSIFEKLYEFILNSRLVLPKYSTFQKIIGQAFIDEELRLQNIIKRNLTKYARDGLDNLLLTTKNYYEISLLKKDQKDFSYTQIKKIIGAKKDHDRLFYFSKKILPKLRISGSNINYYASLVNHYPIAQLRDLPTDLTCLYLLCYIYKRLLKLNDNLMTSFLYYTDKYKESAKTHGKECVYQFKLDSNQEENHDVPNILRLFIDDRVMDQEIRKEAFEIVPRACFQKLIKHITKPKFDEKLFRWQHYDDISDQITKNMRPMFLSLDFQCNFTYKDLEKAIVFLKRTFESKKSQTKIDINEYPLVFIPNKEKSYIIDTDEQGNLIKIHRTRYEFCLYLQIQKGYTDNEVTIQDSITFKGLTDDLVPRHKRNSIMKKLANPLLFLPFKEDLLEQKKALDERYHQVNQRINNGENKSLRVEQHDGKTRIVLLYNKKEDLTNHGFYEQLPNRLIVDLFKFTHQKIGFLHAFTHIKPRNSKAISKDLIPLIAVILANGTHGGISKMAGNSNIDYQTLLKTETNQVRLETIMVGCDLISNAIAGLPICAEWSLQPDRFHGAVDGQKFETRIDTLKARNSAKYFPQHKGISAYTLLTNFIPLSLKTVSPNVHESYCLFDIIRNVTADVRTDIVSGDSHSINPVNQLLMRYLPTEFAPHLKHINGRIKNLASFAHPRKFSDLIISPHHQIDQSYILSEEENMQWIMTSLLYGEVSQKIIVKKLSSLAQHHRTCRAMAEYNRIFESLYTLKYIDDSELRKYVRASLNRIESFHQLRRAVALVNGDNFRGSSELELSIWNQCGRLITLVIIYYNACLLSGLIKKYKNLGDNDAVAMIKRISPIAWIHIIMGGQFEFSTDTTGIDIESIISTINL